VLLIGVAAAYYALAGRINDSALGDEFGATGLPVIYALLLAVIGLALIGQALLGRGRPGKPSELSRHALGRATGMFGIGAAYVALATWFGYFLMCAVTLAAVAWYHGARPNWRLAGYALAGAGAFVALFGWLLGIDLPGGLPGLLLES